MKIYPGTWRSAVALTSVVFAFCGTSRKAYVKPEDISYKNVPGFLHTPHGEVLEWGAAADEQHGITASLQPPQGLRLRWLGTAGFELSDDTVAILIDPFVSRPPLCKLVKALQVDTAAVNRYVLTPLRLENVKAILVSHPHHDHFEDVPYILAQFHDPALRPVVIGSRNVASLLQGYTSACQVAWARDIGGLDNTRTRVVEFTAQHKNCVDSSEQVACQVGKFGEFVITAFGSDHPSYDFLAGVAIDGYIAGDAPYRGTAYKTWWNTSIGYLVEYRGLRFFFAESPMVRHADHIGRVDILLQGIASRRDCDMIAGTLAAVQPRFVIPTHYDDFFKPFTDFREFDAHIGAGFVDFSRFADFVLGFEGLYLTRARAFLPPGDNSFHPRLRLLKLFYYYSLEKLRR